MKRRKMLEKFLSIFLIALLVFPTGLTPVAADESDGQNKVVYHETFEDGISDFIQSGNAKLVHVSDKDFEGNDNGKALYVSERGENDFDAADLSFVTAELKDGYTYKVTVNGFVDDDVNVPSGAEAVLLTIDNYKWLNNVPMVAGETFTLSSTFTVDVASAHTLRFQSNPAGAGVPFYIGEVLIEEVAAPVEEESEPFEPEEVLHLDFEDNSTEGWFNLDWPGHPEADIEITNEAASTGNQSLGYLNRPDDGDSRLAYNLGEKLTPGGIYNISFDVKLKEGTTNVVFASKYVYPGTDNEYPWLINPTEANADEWVTLTLENFEYQYGATELLVWIQTQTADNTASANDFYLDNFRVMHVGMMEEPDDLEEIPEDERIAAFTDFEDGTAQGWVARSGHEELTVTDDDAKNGEYSLLVENRQSSSDAAILDVIDLVRPGYEYKISLWVKLAPGETDTSLQLSAAQTVNGETSYYPPVIAPTMVTDDEWVYLEGTYAVPRNIEALSLYVEEVYDENSTSGVSYYIDDFRVEAYVSDNPVQTDLTPLKEIYKDYFLIGNALESHLFNGRTLELLTHHHNLVTAENVMKPENYYIDGEFNHSRQDQWLQNAVDHGFLIHGHVLLWHSQSEDSLYQNPDGSYKSREEALANMHEHIEKVMISAHEIAGKSIISWDVVNEALDPPNGDWSNPEDWKSKLRHASGWLHSVGDDYIYEAFKHARYVADKILDHPDMVLYYNDYNDHIQAKARTMYHMIKDINERYAAEHPDDDRPLIGGVGMQAHYTTSVNVDNVRESLERFIELGIEVGVTELDVGASETTTLTEEEELQQAYFYAQLFSLYKEHSDHISRVTFWGLSDSHSWRSENNPLLFDRNLQTKLAYYALLDPEAFVEEHRPPEIKAREGNAIYGTPIIDGEIDEIWSEAPVLSIDRFQTAHNGATGEARVLWDNENIYVLVQVNDNELDKSASQEHEQDSVEVFIDEQNTKAASYGEGHGQYRVNFDNEASFNPGEISEGFESRTVVNGTNYLVEMKIPIRTVTLQNGHVIGFDVQINDAVNGSRNSVAIWNDDYSGQGWSDPSVFGNLTLVRPYKPDEDGRVDIKEDEIKEKSDVVVRLTEENNVAKLNVETIKDKEASLNFETMNEDGKVLKVNFPAKVFEQAEGEVEFNLTTRDPEEVRDGDKAKSKVIQLNINGEGIDTTQFEEEVTIEIPVEKEVLKPENLRLAYYNEANDEWEIFYESYYDADNGVVIGYTDHFSTFAVFELTDEQIKLYELEKQVEELEGVIEELKEDNSAKDEQIENLQKGLEKLQQQIDALKDQLADETGSLQEEIDKLNDLIAKLQGQIEELLNELGDNEDNGDDSDGDNGDTSGDNGGTSDGDDSSGEEDDDKSPEGEGTEEDDDEKTEGDDGVAVEEDDDKDSEGDSDKQGDGKEIPKTATNMYNWMFLGAFMVLASAAYLFVSRRKRA